MAQHPAWPQQYHHVAAPPPVAVSTSASHSMQLPASMPAITRPIVPLDVTPVAGQASTAGGPVSAVVPGSSVPRAGAHGYGVPIRPSQARSASTSAGPSPRTPSTSLFPATAGPRQTPASTSVSQHPAPSMGRFVKIAPRSAQPTPSPSQPSWLPPETIAERIASTAPRGRRGPRRKQAPVTAGHTGPAVLQPFVSPEVESSSQASLAVARGEPATLAALPADAPPSLVKDLPAKRKRGHADASDDSP
ncbi:hypothetical protein AURDEDRAFT_146677, partial [Auricularia subglabra TFB-10046 SS5]